MLLFLCILIARRVWGRGVMKRREELLLDFFITWYSRWEYILFRFRLHHRPSTVAHQTFSFETLWMLMSLVARSCCCCCCRRVFHFHFILFDSSQLRQHKNSATASMIRWKSFGNNGNSSEWIATARWIRTPGMAMPNERNGLIKFGAKKSLASAENCLKLFQFRNGEIDFYFLKFRISHSNLFCSGNGPFDSCSNYVDRERCMNELAQTQIPTRKALVLTSSTIIQIAIVALID